MSFKLLEYPDYKIAARGFETGAITAAEEIGISVIIDVFRASNTILELMKSGARVKPVTSVEEALHKKFKDFIRVGEDHGEEIINFHYDNSPVIVSENRSRFKDQNVVVRTTNGTRGIHAAIGSTKVIIGTFQNFTAVVDYCFTKHKEGHPISFVSMGSLDNRQIEDDLCANMFVIKLIETIGDNQIIETLSQNGQNPWIRDWRSEIMNQRGGTWKENDYIFSLQLDTTDIIPVYNNKSGFLEILSD